MPSPQALAAAKTLLEAYSIDHYRLHECGPIGGYDGAWHQAREEDLAALIDHAFATPNTSLPPLDPSAPRRKMVVTIEVAADFEKRLDNQWMVEREIAADRWSWEWAP